MALLLLKTERILTNAISLSIKMTITSCRCRGIHLEMQYGSGSKGIWEMYSLFNFL